MSDAAKRAAELAEKKLSPPIELADASPPAFSDDALAQKFAERHGNDLRYIAAWAYWYAWDSARWERESTLDAFDRARAICRVAASEAEKSGLKMRLTSAKTAAAVERLAKVDRRLAATVEQWETDPDLFNSEEPMP
jgi:phage/plasmid-associated DNA primase